MKGENVMWGLDDVERGDEGDEVLCRLELARLVLV